MPIFHRLMEEVAYHAQILIVPDASKLILENALGVNGTYSEEKLQAIRARQPHVMQISTSQKQMEESVSTLIFLIASRKINTVGVISRMESAAQVGRSTCQEHAVHRRSISEICLHFLENVRNVILRVRVAQDLSHLIASPAQVFQNLD